MSSIVCVNNPKVSGEMEVVQMSKSMIVLVLK